MATAFAARVLISLLRKSNVGWIDDWILRQIIPEGLPFCLCIAAVRFVAVMSDLDEEKAKSKFMGMKNLASIVKARYNKSGNGDGKVAEEEQDFS